MSEIPSVQDYIERENRRRGRGEQKGDGDDGEDGLDPTSGGLYGGGTWENTENDRFGGYSRGDL